MTNEANTSRRWAAAISPLVGLAVGCFATLVQTTFAPVGLFPLLVGLILGSVVGLFFKLAGGDGRKLPVVSATFAALICLVSIHFFSFLHAKAAADTAVELQRKLIQEATGSGAQVTSMPIPPNTIRTFRDYVQHEWDVGRKLGPLPVRHSLLLLWWILDGLLLLVGAAVATLLLAPPAATSSSPTAAAATTGESL